MKTNIFFSLIVSLLFFNSFGQNIIQSEIESKNDSIVVSYYVEEFINMPFGKRVTKYEVTSIDMVNTYNLGPNNKRTVVPIYKKVKGRSSEVTPRTIKIEAIDSLKTSKEDIVIDIVSTYAKVIDSGYKSVDMLIKVADKYFFSNNLVLAEKYYSQLFSITTNLDEIYYFRYAQSLKAINNIEKSKEMMEIFEIKK